MRYLIPKTLLFTLVLMPLMSAAQNRHAIVNPVSQAAGQSGPSTDNDDASHMSWISYYSNGTFLGSGQFHINHPPN